MLTHNFPDLMEHWRTPGWKVQDRAEVRLISRPLLARFVGLFVILGAIGGFQAHPSYVAHNNRRRARYRFTNPQATSSRVAFFSNPR